MARFRSILGLPDSKTFQCRLTYKKYTLVDLQKMALSWPANMNFWILFEKSYLVLSPSCLRYQTVKTKQK